MKPKLAGHIHLGPRGLSARRLGEWFASEHKQARSGYWRAWKKIMVQHWTWRVVLTCEQVRMIEEAKRTGRNNTGPKFQASKHCGKCWGTKA